MVAILSEKRHASQTACQTGSPDDPTTGSKSRETIIHTCGMARSLVLGRMARSPTSTPAAGPTDL